MPTQLLVFLSFFLFIIVSIIGSVTSSQQCDFYAHFCFTKVNFLKVVDLIKEDLAQADGGGKPLSPLQQMALTLSFFSSDAFLRISGHTLGVKKTCAHWTIKRISSVLMSHEYHRYIGMPSLWEMRESVTDLHEHFLNLNMRLLKKPSDSEIHAGHAQDFWCRKQFYALNVQIIGDATFFIRDLEAKWAGSTHDARIWRNSSGRRIIEPQSDSLIVSDTACPISHHLV